LPFTFLILAVACACEVATWRRGERFQQAKSLTPLAGSSAAVFLFGFESEAGGVLLFDADADQVRLLLCWPTSFVVGAFPLVSAVATLGIVPRPFACSDLAWSKSARVPSCQLSRPEKVLQ
jgi:hypothetical protein